MGKTRSLKLNDFNFLRFIRTLIKPVLFTSAMSVLVIGLAPGVTYCGTERVSIAASGGETNQGRIRGINGSISADGRLIALDSHASNFVPDDNRPEGKLKRKMVIQKAFTLQMPFIVNQGQIKDDGVRFYAQTFGGTAYVTDKGEFVYSYVMNEDKKSESNDKNEGTGTKSQSVKGWTLKETLVGASQIISTGTERTESKVNYFIGKDKDKWKTNIPTYNSVNLGQVYDGINLSFKAYGKKVEKIFTVSPGADPSAIKLKLNGSDSLKINKQGELEVETGLGTLRFSKPLAFQEKNGKRKNIQIAYYLNKDTYGFKPGEYDPTLPLIIDPYILSYSTFLGGTVSDDWGISIALDSSGNVYVTGETQSSNFPTTPGAYNKSGSSSANMDAFVTKLNPTGSGLVYSTFLGGIAGEDHGRGIAVDASGNAYITGWTYSDDFPATPGAYDEDGSGGVNQDAFVAKLNPEGSSLIYSTFLAGTVLNDFGQDIAIDASCNAYVTGGTSSSDFPTTPGAYDETGPSGANYDAFVTKLNPDGSSLVYSTFLGGTGTEMGGGIVIDQSGNAYITGTTNNSGDFPTTHGAYDEDGSNGANIDAYVTKLNPDGSDLVYSTFLAGNALDWGTDIAIDATGYVYVTGYTDSSDFPTTPGAYDKTGSGGTNLDAFVVKLNPDGSDLVFSTFLGGTASYDVGSGIDIDGFGNVCVTGYTNSSDFPVTLGAYDEIGSSGTNDDAFVTKINPDGSDLVYSTFLAGAVGNELGSRIAVDTTGNIYVAGKTSSSDFPTTLGAYDEKGSSGTNLDAFVVKLTWPDTDGDGMDDDWEMTHFGDLSHNGTADGDLDGLNDLGEFNNSTDPKKYDSDGDLVPDGVEVNNGTNPNDINDYTPPGTAMVSGTVYDSDGTTPIIGTIRIEVHTGKPCGPWAGYSIVNTELGTGNYAVAGLPPGEYHVEAINLYGTEDYITEWWAEDSSVIGCANAETFFVLAGDHAAGKDFQLNHGAVTISGTVYESDGATPISGTAPVLVNVYEGDDACHRYTAWGYQIINPSGPTGYGQYTIHGLEPGRIYYLGTLPVYDNSYVNEWYTGGSPDPSNYDCSLGSPVTAPATGIDFHLNTGAVNIYGTVSDNNGVPITDEKIPVLALYSQPCSEINVAGISWVNLAYQNANDGTYSIRGLEPSLAPFYLRIGNQVGSRYVSEWYTGESQDPSTQNCQNASPINSIPDGVFGIDFHLDTETTPPSFGGITPEPGHNALVSTDITVHVYDSGSGVDPSSIVMTVGETDYSSGDPGFSISGGPYDVTVTCNPGEDFAPGAVVSVNALARDMVGNENTIRFGFIAVQEITVENENDYDGDGIPNDVETNIFHTDPYVRTLFIRPKQKVNGQYVYWLRFIELFPDSREGFAYIPSFSDTYIGNYGNEVAVPFIEVSVIGDQQNPYPPMRNFNYDPANDYGQGRLPCDILEINYRAEDEYVTDTNYNINNGHPYFAYKSLPLPAGKWSWDTKGLTPVTTTPPLEGSGDNGEYANWVKYGYFTPSIYTLALKMYFLEGAYAKIFKGEKPFRYDDNGGSCRDSPNIQCYVLSEASASPLNLNDADPVNPPPGVRDLNNDTVEMGIGLTFNANAWITSDFPPEEITWTRYSYDQVLKRTIVHELGHALLERAAGSQHCSAPDCIMSANTLDWELHPFGTKQTDPETHVPLQCEHSPGGIYDIRKKVHNGIHSNQ